MIHGWKLWSLVVLGVFALIQLFRPSTSNPPVYPNQEITAHLAMDPGTRSILDRSCYDCHSNQTVWPWYSYVAPVSWLVVSDVNDGRRRMNFSQWGAYPRPTTAKLLDEICRKVQNGGMPPLQYLPMHLHARLSRQDRQQICQWTANTKQSMSLSPLRARQMK